MLQHVDFPTRARGSDTPHILDLVLTNSHCVNNIDTLAPLGKSDHAILLIETTLTNMGSSPDQKYNYNKGDYIKLRSHVDCDWDEEFMSTNLDVEDIWNILKTRIDDGITRFVPLTPRFQSSKWKRPLKEDIRDQIRFKKSLEDIRSRQR